MKIFIKLLNTYISPYIDLSFISKTLQYNSSGLVRYYNIKILEKPIRDELICHIDGAHESQAAKVMIPV